MHETVAVLNKYLANGDHAGAQKYFSEYVEKNALETLKRIDGLIDWHEEKLKKLQLHLIYMPLSLCRL